MATRFRRGPRAGAEHLDPSEVAHLCVFALAGRSCAVDVALVREIVRAEVPAPVPGAPAFIEGVVELRGVLVPVVDLRRRLGLAAAPIDRHARFLVTALRGRMLALLVDRTLDVLRIPRSAIRPAPDWMAEGTTRHVVGLFRRDEPILVLDLTRVLDPAELDRIAPPPTATPPPLPALG